MPQNTTRQDYEMQLSETSGETTCSKPITFTVTNPTGGNITVRSSNENVATASVEGSTITVTPIAQGNAIITVNSAETAHYKAGSATFEVKVEKGTGYIVLDKSSGSVGVGETITLNVISKHGNEIQYHYDSSIVEVSSQQAKTISIRGVGAGTATVTITAPENESYTAATAEFIVTCIDNTPQPSLQDYEMQLSETSGTTTCSQQTTFSVTNLPTGASIMAVSSNNNIATATVDGSTIKVTPIAQGTATITVSSTATSEYKAGSATYQITVNKGIGYITLSESYGEVEKGGTSSFRILSKSGSLSVRVENSLIARVSFGENDTIIITGRRTGETTITITAQENNSYTAQSITYTVRCIADPSNYTMHLSETSGTITCPQQTTFSVTNPTGGRLNVSSSDEDIATARINGSTITVTPRGKKVGSVIITVNSEETDEYIAGSATYELIVNQGTGYISLSATEGTISVGETKTVDITDINGGNLSVRLIVPDASIAIARINLLERKVTITGVGPGKTIITIISEENAGYTESSVTYAVTCIE